MVNNAYLDTASSATPAFSLRATSSRSNCRCSGPAQYKAECIGRASAEFKTTLCFFTVFLHKLSFNKYLYFCAILVKSGLYFSRFLPSCIFPSNDFPLCQHSLISPGDVVPRSAPSVQKHCIPAYCFRCPYVLSPAIVGLFPFDLPKMWGFPTDSYLHFF